MTLALVLALTAGTPAAEAFAQAAPARAAQPAELGTRATATNDLFGAIARNNLDEAKGAVLAGADLGARNAFGLTPIEVAVDRGHYEIVFYLLSVRNSRAAQAEREREEAAKLAAAQPRETAETGTPATAEATEPAATTAEAPAPATSAEAAPPGARAGVPPPPPDGGSGTPIPSVGFLGFTPAPLPARESSSPPAAWPQPPAAVGTGTAPQPVAAQRPAASPSEAPATSAGRAPASTPENAVARASPTPPTQPAAPAAPLPVPRPEAVQTARPSAPARPAETVARPAAPGPAPAPLPEPSAARSAKPAPVETKTERSAATASPAPRPETAPERPPPAPAPAQPAPQPAPPAAKPAEQVALAPPPKPAARESTPVAPAPAPLPALGRGLTLDLRLAALDERAQGRCLVPAVGGGRYRVCLLPADWPAEIASAFNVQGPHYTGSATYVLFDQGQAVSLFTLFRSRAFEAVLAHFQHGFGAPAESRRYPLTLGYRQQGENWLARWSVPGPGAGATIELRRLDDVAGMYVDGINGALQLSRPGAPAVFSVLSDLDLILNKFQRL
ncbi:MAG: ankyrin repeat domain-containing protein [Proteobacteria bacterium]|nr:ankyrin repeat domain-containing protein [Pseudomonadota bacterium]